MQYFIAVIPPPDIGERLRTVGTHLIVGPHITVKAQPGLTEEKRHEWMVRLRGSVERFGHIKVRLGSLASIGSTVAYLEVDSPRLYNLHDVLLRVIDPAPEEAARHFELDGWTPHPSAATSAR